MIIIIYESFEKLDETKRLSIINAGFQIFGEYGYTKASVDDIVKTAHISKGSLFYYFGSKLKFYLYLYEYSGTHMEKLIDRPGPNGLPIYMAYTDFFERLNSIQILKAKHSAEYPHMYNFMKKTVFEEAPAIKDAISNINNRYTKERAMIFFQDLDYYKFKDGIDPMMIIQLLTWCSEGCANQVMMNDMMNSKSQNNGLDFNEVIKLYLSYVELFRNNFYKEEYL